MQRQEPPSSDLQQDDGQKSLEKDTWVHVSMEIPTSEETVGDTTRSQAATSSPVAVLVSVYANGCPLNLTLNSDRGGSKL